MYVLYASMIRMQNVAFKNYISTCLCHVIYFCGAAAHAAQGHLILDVSRSHITTHCIW